MKKTLITLMILTAFTASSQNTIQITHAQAKEAIKTKQRLNVLEIAFEAQEVVISDFVIQVELLRAQVKNEKKINNLWQENYTILESQYEAEKGKSPNWFVKGLKIVLGGVAAFFAGYFVGGL